jgi:glycosyltransferase involved in cell wall biosynthesis
MKIIQIGYYPENVSVIKGGIEASCYGLTRALLRQGHEVVFISVPSRTTSFTGVRREERLSIRFFKNRYRYMIFNFLYFNQITKIIKTERPDVVHLHAVVFLQLLLLIYCRLRRLNVVLTEHGIMFAEHLKRLKSKPSVAWAVKFCFYSLLEIAAVNLSRKTVVDTEYVSLTLRKITRRPLHVIPQGIDASYFDLPDNFIAENLLSIGSINPRKGHEYTIRAMSLVKRRYPKIRLTVAGILHDDMKPYFDSLQQIIDDEGLHDNISIVAGAHLDTLKRLYESANIFVLHSAEESQGIVFCEAMAAGKPVVATNAGGIPFVVKNEENGLLTPFGDVDAFAANILKILDNPDLRTSMSRRSRELATLFNWETIAGEMLKLYKSSDK